MPEINFPCNSIDCGDSRFLFRRFRIFFSSVEPVDVILMDNFLPVITLSINPFFSKSSRCFDADCCDLPISFANDDVVIVIKLDFAPFDKRYDNVSKCWIFKSDNYLVYI